MNLPELFLPGPWSRNTRWGANVRIGWGVVVDDHVIIGDGVFIGHNTVIRSGVTVGSGTVIGHGVVVERDTRIGERVTIQSQCHIAAEAVIGDDVFFGPMAMCINERRIASHGRSIPQKLEGPRVGRGARIGSGALLMPGVRIGENAMVGAKSLVTKDVPPRALAVGSPAEIRGEVPGEELV